jgi:hypothetical protein
MEENSDLYELLDELVKGEDVSWNRTIYTDDKLVDYISQDKDNKKASTIIIEFPDEEDFLYTLGVDDDDDIWTYKRFNSYYSDSDIDYYRYEEDFREGYLLDNFDESNTLKLNNILRFLNPSLIGGDKDKIGQFLTQSFPSESDEIIYEYGYRDRDCIERAVKEEINSETKNPFLRFGIKEIYNGEIIENFRYDRKEIDIYLPELKIGFEYNGLYWHSELNKNKNYHYDKLLFFNNLGINLIQVWEDDWKYKQNIIKSMISNKILKSERIFARKCEIKEIVDNKLIRDFLEENHIQGFVGSNIKLGLFFNNELVSLMTFGNLRKSLGQVSKKGVYELLRFCNKLNTSVIGGASKLFNFFIKNYKVEEVISYSLNSYSDGNLYKNIGFNLENNTDINYFWCKNGIKYHRFNFRKDKLVKEGYDVTKTESEIMYERGYFKVFDCGSKKWIYKIIIKKTDLLN